MLLPSGKNWASATEPRSLSILVIWKGFQADHPHLCRLIESGCRPLSRLCCANQLTSSDQSDAPPDPAPACVDEWLAQKHPGQNLHLACHPTIRRSELQYSLKTRLRPHHQVFALVMKIFHVLRRQHTSLEHAYIQASKSLELLPNPWTGSGVI